MLSRGHTLYRRPELHMRWTVSLALSSFFGGVSLGLLGRDL
jgi:hypothetical protein